MVNKFLYPNGGSETYIFKIGKQLQAMGHEVQYFGMEHEGRCVGNAVGAYSENLDFHKEGKLSKITYPIKTIYSKDAREKIGHVLRDFSPDVVHLNNFTYQLTPSIILEIVKWKEETGHPCRIIFTAHDYNLVCPNHMLNNPITHENCEACLGGHFMNCTKGKCIHGSTARSLLGTIEAYYWNHRKVYESFDAMICCSHFMKQKMDTNPIFARKTVYLPNFAEPVGVSVEKKQNEAQQVKDNLPEGFREGYVLYFGRYAEEKGIATLIQACRELPDIPFVFAGTGPLKEDLSGIANVKDVGFLSGDALASLIRGARFSVYPSEWYENAPFSVMESELEGTPVLGADIGGLPELIEDKKTGELFPSQDKEALKNAIHTLWAQPERAKQYGENCRRIHYDSVEEYCQKLLRIYGVEA